MIKMSGCMQNVKHHSCRVKKNVNLKLKRDEEKQHLTQRRNTMKREGGGQRRRRRSKEV